MLIITKKLIYIISDITKFAKLKILIISANIFTKKNKFFLKKEKMKNIF